MIYTHHKPSYSVEVLFLSHNNLEIKLVIVLA